jgi:DNA-binding CsgD family transcriptional regulator
MNQKLTATQTKILELVQTKKPADVAKTLGVTLSTVNNHLNDSYRILGANSRYEAICKAKRKGLIQSPSKSATAA